MRYEDHLIDQIQSASDIVDVISQYLPMKRAGRNFKAVCPFHQEKTPSFMVHPEKQIFHCFGCGAGGNVFGFLMRHENMSFPEALRQLAERAHIRLPEPSARKGEGPSETEQLYEVYRLACEYYHAQWVHPQRGEAARAYFKKRGFEESAAGEFKLGWALPSWRGLFEFLAKKGFPDSLLLRSGLIQRASGGNLYDLFRGRILFPIRNLQGKVVAFGGRVIDEKNGPKYLNSPENPVFHKRRELFGLDVAKKHIDRDHPRILVVEGYLDFLRLYTQGFKTVVATLGTALTDEHVQVLKRFAEEAVVIYDGDKAGESASLRGLEVFLEGAMNVKLVRLPSGFDPDDFLAKKGPGEFQNIVDQAKDFFDYKLEIALNRHNRNDALGLMKITNDFLETLIKVSNPILLSHYLKKLTSALGLDEPSLRAELAKLQKKAVSREKDFSRKNASPSVKDLGLSSGSAQLNKDEVMILALMVEDAVLRDQAFQVLQENDFADPKARELFQRLHGNPGIQKSAWPQMLNHIPDESWKEQFVGSASWDWSVEDRRKAFQDCLAKIRQKNADKELKALRRDIAAAEKERDHTKLTHLVREYQSLLQRNVRLH
ncbi:MAG TPA: DNA primase [bacterium]|nr:DNA primase [bacterium]